MTIVRLSKQIVEPFPEGHAATIGFFDGVHRGHRFLVEQLQRQAGGNGLKTMVVTFDCHPRQVVQAGWRPQLLTTLAEKERLVSLTGIDTLVVLPFDQAMASLSARQFMRQVLHGQLGVKLLLTGFDNRFGHRDPARSEGFDDYVRYGRELGIDVVCGEPLLLPDGRKVSSSLVRQLLEQGDVATAATCLGRPYSLSGTVGHGRRMGHRLGFPTANLCCADDSRMIPASGVYAVRVAAGSARQPVLAGVTNIGTNPTFGGSHVSIETHILDFHSDVYGQPLSLQFVARLRPERRFDSPEALAAQMQCDVAAARDILNTPTT